MDALCIAGLLAHHARYQPEAVAVVFGEQRLSWREFAARCGELAQAMAQAGVQPGDRVATVLGNCLELLTIYWACADLGAVAVPLSPLLQCSGLQSLLQDAAPKIVFASEATQADVSAAIAALSVPVRLVCVAAVPAAHSYAGFVAGCAAMQQRPHFTPEHPCNIMYTSGTTGQPKGILLTHRVRAHYAALMASIFRLTPESVVLHTGAIVFNGAYVMMMPAFAQGARYVLHGAFDARAFVATVAREKVTHTMLVPSQIAAILDLPDLDPVQLLSLQVVLSLGAPLPLARKQALESLLPGRLHELYGLTEGFITVLDRRDTARKLGSVGVPPPFFELRIVREDGSEAEVGEIGEIAGRGPLLMSGYYGQPELTAQTIRDGWLYSGDIGRIDEEGYLYLVDRKKDMIDSGGVKVYPRDIEEVIATHPDVAEVVVFGVPDEKWGETPFAVVQMKQTFGKVCTPEQLRDWINVRVAARYQRVSAVALVSSFPRNAAGKILKRELRAPYWEGRERAI
ncbi:class I adenylate-forming enzyme family protein [Pseudoduganella danionis]|uniref:AMP-binding protein n=1 Tax=Pseudoduganella danionis TaxID=1890295 RepID=A0ABW9SSU8_9BURK|nr:AMP-binding protein [Pseudoduganella danionis]MTW35246.1 AMP-binding protein [Pseudoduganella danionis]